MASRKPETTFSNSINKRLPLGLHYEKMNNPYRGGTADFWYSGDKSDMWVEYKWIPKIPKKVYSLLDGKSPPLSKLQQDWLSKRHDEGRHVAVILGLPEGVILLDGVSWQNPIDFTKLVSREEAAKWIVKETVNECIKPAIRRSKNNDTNL
jgi:hypothetical protein